MNPLVLGLLFFVTITPIGLGDAGLSSKDFPAPEASTSDAKSYWIERAPPESAAAVDEKPVLIAREGRQDHGLHHRP